MPARIHPLAIAQHEDLGHAADLINPLTSCLQLVRVIGVHNRRVAVNLYLGLRELQLKKFSAAFGKLLGAFKDRLVDQLLVPASIAIVSTGMSFSRVARSPAKNARQTASRASSSRFFIWSGKARGDWSCENLRTKYSSSFEQR